MKTVSELPKRLIIGLRDGYCNLKCPMCHVHGSKEEKAIKSIRGKMSLENACRIFDQIVEAQPEVNPNIWGEPFVMKDINKYILAMKERNIRVIINSNGLLLTDKLVDFLLKIKIDSIFISIDAVTKPTFKKIRGVESLDKIKDLLFMLLRKRGDCVSPRIGVSFVANEINRHEEDEFVAYWLKYVDVVRVAKEYSPGGLVKGAKIKENRLPCGALYDTMVINHRGDAVICCLDSFYKHKVGNVFKDGIRATWRSEALNEVRHYHETGQYEKVPFCKDCQVWANYLVEDELKGNILIRRSPVTMHYNRADRMNTWGWRVKNA